jgi:hypothetical protein
MGEASVCTVTFPPEDPLLGPANAFADAQDAFRRWHVAMEEWERDHHADPNGLARGEQAVRRQNARLHRLNAQWLTAVERCRRVLAERSG